MKNVNKDQMRAQMEQMKNMSNEEVMAQMRNAGPQAAASGDYHFSGAQQLKNQGNQLFGQGKYAAAVEKYVRAKANLGSAAKPEWVALKKSCCLNLAACYLKLNKPDECIAECTEVIKKIDSKNLKAYYRRGQAHKEKGHYENAVGDLRLATSIDPADATAQEALQAAEKLYAEHPGTAAPVVEDLDAGGPEPEGHVEEVVEEVGEAPPAPAAAAAPRGVPPGMPPNMDPSRIAETRRMMAENPEMLKTASEMMKNMSEEDLARMGQQMGGAGFDPGMAKMAADMMGKMDPADIQQMMDMMQGQEDVAGAQGDPGKMQEKMAKMMEDPNMMDKVTKMMSNMDTDDLIKMSEQAGMKLDPAQVEKLKQMKPEHMQMMMKGVVMLQKVAMKAQAAKRAIMERRSLQLALAMLVLAILLRLFGIA